MRFESPIWLWLIILLPLVWMGMRRKRPVGIIYSSLSILPSKPETFRARLSRIIPPSLRILALLIIILALARPIIVWGEENEIIDGVDIVLTTDISSSMSSRDLGSKTRLDYSKEVIKDFIGRRSGERIGLVVFSGRAYTQAPLTVDHDILLGLVDQTEIGLIEDGTAIGMAIGTAINRLRESKAKSRVIVLLTDGENNAGVIDPVTSARIAKELGIKIYTVGVGSKEGYRFTVRDPNSGQMMSGIYRFNEPLLKKIAEITTGSALNYFNATNSKQLMEIYRRIDELEKTRIEVKKYEKTGEMFAGFSLAALFILILEAVLGETVFRRIPV